MIKNVVFDLGSVIWNLHHKREYQTEDDYDFIKENLYGTKITKQLDLGNTTMDDVFEILKEKAKSNDKINIQNLKTLLQNQNLIQLLLFLKKSNLNKTLLERISLKHLLKAFGKYRCF